MDENMDVSCRLKDLGAFRIDSFNYVVNNGLKKAALDILPVYTTSNIKISISDVVMEQLKYPMDLRNRRWTVYPSEARLRASTYYAELHVQLCFQRGEEIEFSTRTFYVPVMVKSDFCLLKNLTEDELVKVKEDINDPGGYFIVKGKERLFRHFIVSKRNYPLAFIQTKWKSYRKNFTEYGILVRSVKDECKFSTVFLHLLNDGNFEIRLYFNLTPYFIQVMLIFKALVDESDMSIINKILKYHKDFPVSKLKNILYALHNEGIYTHNDAKVFLGKKVIAISKLNGTSPSEAAEILLRKSLLVHLDSFEEKFEFLCFSLCKLHCVVTDKCRFDDIDNPIYQEVLSTGHIYLLMLKDGMQTYLKSVQFVIGKSVKNGKFSFRRDQFERLCNRARCFSPTIASMIATGNFTGKQHGLLSDTGYTIALKRTNVFQLASQFNMICKFSMAFSPRNLRVYYPENWGFLCPTETPEGENSGLYNQLTSQCKIVNLSSKRIDEDILFKFGVIPCNDPLVYHSHHILPVFVDGKIIGWINVLLIGKLLFKLRKLRSSNSNKIPYYTEIIYIAMDQKLFPGVYLFSLPCRMIRKIFNEQNQKEEFVGIFEQLFLQDTCSVIPGEHSYSEIKGANILSLSARMIPFCENNSAVRNIFSSVKCKQALGLPFLNFNGRSDTKTHQLVHAQSPIVSTKMYSESNFDFYPCGTNVIVAVLSYSSFDMEDALVLNKASVERGLMQNMLYKTIYYDLEELAKEHDCKSLDIEFKSNEMDPFISDFLDEDGLPFVGVRVRHMDPILSLYNSKTGQYIIKQYPERYTSHIHSVRLMGEVSHSSKIPKQSKKISITFWSKRVPEVGDKFNMRHGGKGICSAVMQSEDLPFSADGMIPDILFNPHGLPTRMSIGMLFEMVTSKAVIQKGAKYVVEPFETNIEENDETFDEIGESLIKAGFSYYGNETFYSGTSGELLTADVFCGCMYYFRLHHVVEEKYQVRSLGPVDEKTNQPINPNKSGAVRFGEMERDAILSHGSMALTLDRLLINSDKCTAFVCRTCHLLILPTLQNSLPELRDQNLKEESFCRLCQKNSTFKIQIPYVLVYLICELAVLGINVKLSDK